MKRNGEAGQWHSSNFPQQNVKASDGHVLNIGLLLIIMGTLHIKLFKIVAPKARTIMHI